MNLELGQSFDSFMDGTKEVAETAHVKTNEFHEKYISKVVPDCGKYGDVAKFVAEMAPGVSEYNAIREGDWQAFAIAAGLDVASIAVGAVTMGAGYAAAKGGAVAAKQGVKAAAREVLEAGTKKAAKEVTEAGAGKAVKEAAEAGAKKAAKEVAEAGAEKTTKEVVEADIKEIAKDYLDDLKTKSDFVDTLSEIKLDVSKLEIQSPERIKDLRVEFDKNKARLRMEWEKLYNREWPKYKEDVFNEVGIRIRRAGDCFDAHHIKPLQLGGPNVASNLTPLDLSKHNEIHSANGSCQKLVEAIKGVL